MVRTLGPHPERVLAAWSIEAQAFDAVACWRAHVSAGVGVVTLGSSRYPPCLSGDVEPPPVLFHRGDLDDIGASRVAIVGTRRCTGAGADVARELGRELTTAGVQVVSGLALGIDGAAHRGALESPGVAGAPPVAVVASGVDVVYPRRNAPLWQAVAATGVLLTEAPLGREPTRWRFPARNRIIAALADVVVVVESSESGGSMYTVAEALRRDRPVMAVPGSVRSAASRGTNKLLYEGATPARDATDILVALGRSVPTRTPSGGRRPDPRPLPVGDRAAVLESLGWQPATPEQLARRTGMALGPLSEALTGLSVDGWIEQRGGWIERRARPESDR